MRWLLAAGIVLAIGTRPGAEAAPPTPQEAAAEVDRRLAEDLASHGLHLAPPVDDARFLRRATLDLAGRIPTPGETAAFLADPAPDKHVRAVRRLIAGPEFPLQMASVLDETIQERHAGSETFVNWLRTALRERRPWDALFRELLVGPWETDAQKPANRFLDRRGKDPEVMATDTARIFFGVDVTCARCHDHPLAADWKQEHFYGLTAFFVRTTGGKGTVSEKSDGEVKFLSKDGEKTATMMFLSGTGVAPRSPSEPSSKKPPRSRREDLVDLALADRTFLSRAAANRLWENFFGRGLVHPVDQIHSGNPPSVPGVLEFLAAHFADSNYDVHALCEILTSTRLYRAESRWDRPDPLPAPERFATAAVRPLTARQFSLALSVATGPAIDDDATPKTAAATAHEGELRKPTPEKDSAPAKDGAPAKEGTRPEPVDPLVARQLEWEKQAADLLKAFDSARPDYHATSTEALFVSNHAAFARYVAATEGRLAARLAAVPETDSLVDEAVRHVLSRPCEEAERRELAAWFERQSGERTRICERLVWALATSAEFRFNH